MKTEELKLKAIQDAYGEYFEKCKPNKDGWSLRHYEEIGMNIYGSEAEFNDFMVWRPISLKGIENNRGWIRIEEDGSNLPNGNDADDFWICNENGLFDFFSYPEQIERKFRNGTVTHYQPVIKPKPPIY